MDEPWCSLAQKLGRAFELALKYHDQITIYPSQTFFEHKIKESATHATYFGALAHCV